MLQDLKSNIVLWVVGGPPSVRLVLQMGWLLTHWFFASAVVAFPRIGGGIPRR